MQFKIISFVSLRHAQTFVLIHLEAKTAGKEKEKPLCELGSFKASREETPLFWGRNTEIQELRCFDTRAEWALAPPLPEAGQSDPSMEKGRTYLLLSSSSWASRGSSGRDAESSSLSLTGKGRLDWAGDSTTEWSFSETANQFWQHAELLSKNTEFILSNYILNLSNKYLIF